MFEWKCRNFLPNCFIAMSNHGNMLLENAGVQRSTTERLQNVCRQVGLFVCFENLLFVLKIYCLFWKSIVCFENLPFDRASTTGRWKIQLKMWMKKICFFYYEWQEILTGIQVLNSSIMTNFLSNDFFPKLILLLALVCCRWMDRTL
jgi:hypothetical protein